MKRTKNKKRIHKHIRKASPKGVHKAKKLFNFKYPKLFFLVASIILAYYLFSNTGIASSIESLNELKYFGAFIAGIFIAFGFSAPFSVGYFLTAQPENIFLLAIVGGMGAAFGDFLIFRTIKFSFMNEFNELKKSRVATKVNDIVNDNINIKIKHYALYLFAGIVITTPLPDEIGVSLLAGLTTIKETVLTSIGFILNTIGIYLIIVLGISIG